MMKKIAAILIPLALAAATTSSWSADVVKGKKLYELHCAVCHGITGIPVTPQTPNLAMREGMNKPDMMLLQSLKTPKGAKPSFFGILDDQKLLDIIQYIRVMR